MNPKAMEPYGEALLEYFRGDRSAVQIIHRDDGLDVELPASTFFRGPSEFTTIERKALALCSGTVLDIGAGTGRHSLVLQERGLEVVALDIAPQVGEIMTKLGVRNVVCGDIFDFDRGTYDTLLLLLHGIGMVGDLQGLARFLNHIRGPTRPGGVLLLDSLDVRCSTGPVNLAYQERNRKQNRYIGEIRMAFEYKGRAGPMLSWLQVDPDMMHEVAIETGWTCEILHQDPWGDYLARLSP